MDLSELRDYHKWIGRSPEEVLLAVKALGGWDKVFPTSLPPWASKIRNYFNETPKRLKRLNTADAEAKVKQAQQFLFAAKCAEVLKDNRDRYKVFGMSKTAPEPLPAGCPAEADLPPIPSWTEKIQTEHALSGDVYLDEFDHVWFQMTPGGAIYHYGAAPRAPTLEALWAASGGQQYCPVFKLVSPDGTGGSRECILDNPTHIVRGTPTGGSQIGRVDEWEEVSGRLITELKYQSTYNYSETMVKGPAAHNLRDVKPHNPDPNFYVNPAKESPLGIRRFPENDNDNKPLADQVGEASGK
jgi:hypothetical protein